ncbi:MAG: hypothetical protein FVQ80_05935 [Planctomycetes bacterium]|nr:hypothetical protein [Planctomycetota bacterium]
MSDTMANKLSKQKLQQIITTLGPQPAEDNSNIETTDYDWNQPRYFSDEHMKVIEQFTNDFADALAKNFSKLYNTDFNASVNSNTQHFASKFQNADSDEQKSNCCLAFGTEQDPHAGVIVMPVKTAIDWATQLLGDSEPSTEERDLSQLEETLLLDILNEMTKALSSAHGGYQFIKDETIVKGNLPIKLQDSEELLKIELNIEKTDSGNPSQVYILILSSKLASLVGKTDMSDQHFSPDDISEAIIENLQQMPVPVTTRLASTMFTFDQIMNLQPNDILMLGKEIDDTLEVIVEGKTVFRGKPAKCNGKYAVVITEKCQSA